MATNNEPGEFWVFDVRAGNLSGLNEADVIFAYVDHPDRLPAYFRDVRDAMEASHARRGALVLPFGTRLYKYQEILEYAAAHAVFCMVPSDEEWGNQMPPETIVRARFTSTDLDLLSTSWIEDLEQFQRRLPEAKGFGTDPALFEYFR